jgi:hypothetical protein
MVVCCWRSWELMESAPVEDRESGCGVEIN